MLLEMESVSRQYAPGRRGVVDASLQVEAGDVVGLVGPSGSGKTTLLRLALGLMEPNAGRIRVFGADPWKQPGVVRSRLGYAAEAGAETLASTIEEMTELHQTLYERWDAELAARLLGALAHDRRQRIDRLSKGQARRVMLACAMAHRPELLLLDEPAGGLDPGTRRDFLELAIELLSESGTTIVLSSHHLTDVERIASRVLLLDQGRVRLDVALDELREQYCLATFTNEAGGSRVGATSADCESALRTLAGFVGCRVRGQRVQAVFRASPEPAERALRERGFDATCGHSNLEDLFITIVGESA